MKLGFKLLLIGVAGAVALGYAYHFQTSRLTVGRIEEIKAATQRLAAVEPQPDMASASTEGNERMASIPAPAADSASEPAPDVFKARFECSNGTFVVECRREWAPLGADRFYRLVKLGIYDEARFFRVVVEPRPFIVQFGIPGDPEAALEWRDATIPDDPVRQSNTAGTVTFAMRGPNTRTTQVFINLDDNPFLDRQGFSPIGKVIEGMDVVRRLNPKYGEQPDQARIQTSGTAYLASAFPDMDYVKRAVVVE